MKPKLTVALTLFALAIPVAIAQGAPRSTYIGHLAGSPDSTVKLKEAFGDLERAVKVFSVREVPIECRGDVTAVVGRTKLKGSIPVDKDGDFGARDDNGKTLFKVRGHIGRNKATGSFRYSGKISDQNGDVLTCDSGKQTWVARFR
jgi:hypothetical protein